MNAPVGTLGGETGAKLLRGNSTTEGKFSGTDNPRHLRVIFALLRRAMPREHVDREAGCSNGPDMIAELRRRGLEIPCTKIEAFDRDGLPCRPGVYHFTAADRRKVHRWLAGRGRVHG